MSHRVSAIKRLLHDLKEVLASPLPDVVAHPLQDDLFLWHGNVRGSADSAFTDVPFHFMLVFGDDYPRNPPMVGLYTRLPHPNIVRWTGSAAKTEYRLALWDCNPTENQWSSAYTIHSMLIQIQAFLIAENMMWSSQTVSLDQAIRRAYDLRLEECDHSGWQPWPAFSTEQSIAQANTRAKTASVAVRKPQHKKSRSEPLWAAPTAKPKQPKPQPKVSDLAVVQKDASNVGEDDKSSALVKDEASAWKEVRKGKRFKAGSSNSAPEQSALNLIQQAASNSNPFANLTKKNQTMLDKLAKEKSTTPDKSECSSESLPEKKQSSTVGLDQPPPPLTKSSKKNAARARKRAEKQSPNSSETSSPASTPPPSSSPLMDQKSAKPQTPPPGFQQMASSVSKVNEWQEIPQKLRRSTTEAKVEAKDLGNTPHNELIQAVVKEAEQGAQDSINTVDVERDTDMGLDMGMFTLLPTDVINTVLMLVSRKDMAALATTCKGWYASCSDGEIWKMLLERDFARTQITASRSSDWKHAYQLQASHVLENLQCFHSKASFEDEVLGMPLYYTINPKKQCVDYIAVGVDLLSITAFKQGVHKPATKAELSGQNIMDVCPVYLDEDHFKRALPHLNFVLKKLNPDIPAHRLNPSNWLDTCAKMLNTSILLLIDKGMEASQMAIHAYCQVHRLMLALAEHYKLWDEAVRRLDAFLKFPAKRDKYTCPNLGWLIALLAVSPKHNWKDINIAVLLELLDRSVIWACKGNKDLVNCYKKPESAGGEDKQLLDGVFESTRVSRGLIAFHSAFMREVARPYNVSLEAVMDQSDSMFGFASETQSRRIQQVVRRCQQITSWADFFKLIGAQPNTGIQNLEAFMTGQLRRSWENSLSKKYHTKSTDFSRIQASGVSQILLKGQSYSAPPNMRAVHVTNNWKSQHGGVFLDLSVLLFAFDGHHICSVDYSNQNSIGTERIGAVSHSGDQHTFEVDAIGVKMSQSADICLDCLGRHVKEVYLVGSAWHTNLSHIMQPCIVLSDTGTGTELCQYQLEEFSREKLKNLKCVMMCKIHRETSSGSWRVEAMGDMLPSGDAADYRPIINFIHHRSSARTGRS